MSPERRLLGYMRPYKGLFLLALLTALLASVLDGFTVVVLIPLLKSLFGTAGELGGVTQLEQVMDWLMTPILAGTTPAEATARITVVLVLGLLFKNAMSYSAAQLNVSMQEGLVRDLRSDLFDHLLNLDLDFFQRTRSGQLIAGIISDVDTAKSAVAAALASFFQNLVMILVFLVIMGLLSWKLTLLTLGMAPILVFGIQGLLRRLRRHSRARAHERGEIVATVTERLAAIKLIRAYGGEKMESERFRDQATKYRKGVIRTQRYSTLTSPVSEIFGGIILILIIYASTLPAFGTGGVPLDAEDLIVFLVLALRMLRPLKAITQFPAIMAVAMASAERIFHLLDIESSETPATGETDAVFMRDLAFDGVTFAYGENDSVLEDVSFTVPRGAVAAIVGPSGAGKTTLVDLLPRFNDPDRGEVRVDGIPTTRLSRRSLRALMGVVSQDTVLLNDTVRANIAYGMPGADDAAVEAAARAANAHEFIATLPAGYETLLGERGTRLSGGQRQRISIARALLRDPPILILDEATSALDAESERLVQEAIDRLMEDRTVLVIAHRLATVRHADQIIVLSDGKVVELGSHAELFERGGLYRRLYDLQFREVEQGMGR